MINVTKTFLPPLEEYTRLLAGIWERVHLTNRGPLVRELEERLCALLGVPNLLFVCNGTIALQIAIKALDLKGEVITTPFSYVATTSSIVWEGCTPVFVDIDPETLCIDPGMIEQAITPRTSAILATHVYGIPCDVDRIAAIARKHGLKVVYDAAHAFGVRFKGQSLLTYGDIATLSFHATKLFHTGEGGGVVVGDPVLKEKIFHLHNFGHKGYEDFCEVGVNGKSSEFHAAMGLALLPHVGHIMARRRDVSEFYDRDLSGLPLKKPRLPDQTEYNFSYHPVIFPEERSLLRAVKALNSEDIFPRRYFYPCLSRLNYVERREVPVAEDIAGRILCLPTFADLSEQDQARICAIIRKSLEEAA